MAVITVASYKGGVGKTTTAIHLAGYLQHSGQTLLVDGDPNQSCLSWADAGTNEKYPNGQLPFKVCHVDEASTLASSYKHLVIDTQARPSDADLKALTEECDLLVLATTPDALALRALLQTVDTLNSLASQNYRILLTAVPSRPNTDGDAARELLKDMGLPVFVANIRQSTAFRKAALEGTLVKNVKAYSSSLGWRDYLNVGKELL